MPRIVKNPEARQSELLDCAQALFFEHGYDRTTVSDIIGKAGISKGGFYHHFSSKEQILEALATRLGEEALAQVQDVMAEPTFDALARLNAFFGRLRRMKVEDAPRLRAMFDVVFRPENIVLYHRINAASARLLRPALAQIIKQGRDERLFDVANPELAASVILQLGSSTYDAVARAIETSGTSEATRAADALEEQLTFLGISVDRILGLPDKSVVFVEPGFVQAIMSPQTTRP